MKSHQYCPPDCTSHRPSQGDWLSLIFVVSLLDLGKSQLRELIRDTDSVSTLGDYEELLVRVARLRQQQRAT